MAMLVRLAAVLPPMRKCHGVGNREHSSLCLLCHLGSQEGGREGSYRVQCWEFQ